MLFRVSRRLSQAGGALHKWRNCSSMQMSCGGVMQDLRQTLKVH